MDTFKVGTRYVLVTLAVLILLAVALVRVGQSDNKNPKIHEYCLSQSIRDTDHGVIVC